MSVYVGLTEDEMSFRKVAIDGPAGAGKSTISRAVAEELGYVYIDTGAMYRACALKMLRKEIDISGDVNSVIKAMNSTEIEIAHGENGQIVYLDGEDVTGKIRTAEVSKGASDIAKIPEVRLKLVDIQRALAQKCNCIMDGRDIGTYVLPDADVKIFLTASVEERAKRRYAELVEKGVKTTPEEVLSDMKKRDANDSGREFAPLKQAEDSVLVDTTGNTLEKSVELLKDIIIKNLNEI